MLDDAFSAALHPGHVSAASTSSVFNASPSRLRVAATGDWSRPARFGIAARAPTVQASSWILAVVVEKIDNLSERAYRSTVPDDDARKDREKQRQGNGEPA
jgi:hypothetical protein